MPHGAPDWYKYRRDSATHPVDDLAELAVRLGSPVTFDRRGDVFFLDSFEFGFPSWTTFIAPAGGSVSLTPITTHHGGYSLKLTTQNITGSMARVQRFVPYPHISRVGLELAFAFDTNVRSLWAYLGLWTGAARYQIQVKYCPPLQELSIYTSPPGWTVIQSNLILDADPEHWHRLKIVADLTTRTYARLLLDHLALNLSDYAVYFPASADNAKTQFSFHVDTDVDDHATAYLDAVIITQDEP